MNIFAAFVLFIASFAFSGLPFFYVFGRKMGCQPHPIYSQRAAPKVLLMLLIFLLSLSFGLVGVAAYFAAFREALLFDPPFFWTALLGGDPEAHTSTSFEACEKTAVA